MKKVLALSFIILGLSITQVHALSIEQYLEQHADKQADSTTPNSVGGSGIAATPSQNVPSVETTQMTVQPQPSAVESIATSAGITKTLRYGMKNDAQVMTLQTFLIQKGYLVATADGNFGPKTLAAVKKFQLASNLPLVGIVGPMTRALIR